jgi:hypothetical protein
MIKVQLDDERSEIGIVKNDRGEWTVANNMPSEGCWILTGFGGENAISIHIMEMQGGNTDFVIVHSCVDNPARVIQRQVKTGFDDEALNFALNQVLAQVCTYPEVLPEYY